MPVSSSPPVAGQPRRTLSVVPLTPKQKTALKAAYSNLDIDTELTQNALMDMARNEHPVAIRFAHSGVDMVRVPALEPHFHFTGNRRYRNVLVTDGESFGLLSQEADGLSKAGKGQSPTRLEVIMASALPFALVSRKPRKEAILRFYAAHVNWLLAGRESMDAQGAAKDRGLARIMCEHSEAGPAAAVLLFDDGAPAETAMDIPFVPPVATAVPTSDKARPSANAQAAPNPQGNPKARKAKGP